jgi:hypothetical protein
VAAGVGEWAAATGSSKAKTIFDQVMVMLAEQFEGSPTELHSLGAQHTISPLLASAARAYAAEANGRFLKLCESLLKLLEMPAGGDYVRRGLTKQPYNFNRVDSWHGLLALEGIARLATARTMPNSSDLEAAVVETWWSLCENERRNTGALLSGDQAGLKKGGPPKTTGTAGWANLCAEVLNLTSNPIVVDEIELTVYNAGLFVMAPSDRTCPTEIPSAGKRGIPTDELAEASLAGPSILANVGRCALKTTDAGINLNLYSAGKLSATLKSGLEVGFAIETEFPYANKVDIVVSPSRRGERFQIALRIPSWSTATGVTVDRTMGNQPETFTAGPGLYYPLEYEWSQGDRITIDFDFSLRFWKQGAEACIFRGPILLALEQTPQQAGFEAIKASALQYVVAPKQAGGGGPALKLNVVGAGFREPLTFCDYASAGLDPKVSFSTYFPIDFEGKDATATPFSRHNSLRTFHIPSPEGGFEIRGASGGAASARLPMAAAATPLVAARPTLDEEPKGLGGILNLAGLGIVGDVDRHATLWTRKKSPASTTTPPADLQQAPFVANSSDLDRARAFQASLRKEKVNLEKRAAGVNMDTSQAFGRKSATRNMLSDVLGPSASPPATSQQAYDSRLSGTSTKTGPGLASRSFALPPSQPSLAEVPGRRFSAKPHRSSSDLTRSRSYDNALDDVGKQEDEGEGYVVATAEETAPDVAAAAKARDVEVLKSELSRNVTVKRSWRNGFRKQTFDQFGNKIKGQKKSKRGTSTTSVESRSTEPTKRGSVSNVATVPTSSNPFGGNNAQGAAPKSSWGGVQSPNCFFCQKAVYAMEKGEADAMVFHKMCFRCSECNKVVKMGTYASLEGKIYCKAHFKQLFKLKGNYNEGFGSAQHKMKWATMPKK